MWSGLLPVLGVGMLVYETAWGTGRWPIVVAGLALCTQTAPAVLRALTRSRSDERS